MRISDWSSDVCAADLETGAERDARGYNEVYDLDISSSFAGREEVERYKGVNTADVLKGRVNVFSGDARNGGRIDHSTRGMQGQGRVQVLLAGTERAPKGVRGYTQASNLKHSGALHITNIKTRNE